MTQRRHAVLIRDLTNEELDQEINKYRFIDAYASKHSLQAPMGYEDNCTYNYFQSLKVEKQRRSMK